MNNILLFTYMARYLLLFVVFCKIAYSAEFPIYSDIDGYAYIEYWENIDEEDNELHSYQKDYINCTKEVGAIITDNGCINRYYIYVISKFDDCVEYLYLATKLIRETSVNVKKSDLIGYAFNKEETKPIIRDLKNDRCK